MKKYTMLTLEALALTLLVTGAFAQPAGTMPAGKEGMHSHSSMSATDSSAMNCSDMMKMHEGMQKKMAAMDTKLEGLVADMNEAKGSSRVDKMAAVINELVAQRSAMIGDMMSMQPMMMKHMMGHMQSGMMKGMGEGMSGCPMMAGTDAADATKHDDHH